MKMLNRGFWLFLAAGSLGILLGAQQNRPTFAFADIVQVVQDSKQHKAALSQYESRSRAYLTTLQTWVNTPLVLEADFKQALEIASNTAATDADKAKATAIWRAGTDRMRELQTLQSKAQLSDPERKRLQELTQQLTATQGLVNRYNQSLKAEMDQWRDRELQQTLTLARTVVADLAKRRNVTVVYDSSFAAYAETDLTKSATEEMNKRR